MELAIKPSKISRVDRRYRHLAQDVGTPKEPVQPKEATSEEDEEEVILGDVEEPLLLREQKRRRVMGRAHRMFHRRQAQPSNTLTVAVEVVATVNDQGVVIAQETRTLTGTAGVGAAAVPTIALPSVPAVPPFPSDLLPPSVPAFPFPSGVPTALPLSVTTQPIVSSPLPTSTVLSDFTSALTPGLVSSGFNSTTSSTLSTTSFSTSTTLSSSSTTSLSSTSSSSRTSSSSSTSSRSSSSSLSSSSTSLASSTSALATSSSPPEGGAGVGPAATGQPPVAETSPAAEATDGGDNSSLGTPKVVGSVIGSLAGAALLLVLILFLLKRHKRKGTLQLSGADDADNEPISSSGEQMATRSSYVTPSFLNRFSMASRSTADTSTTGERGFQRISGRKLPSAFSEGMTSEQFTRGEGTLSGSSFYQDDKGFYGGPGPAGNKEFGKEASGPSNYGTIGAKERIMPSPARTPIIHHPDDAPPFGANRSGGNPFSPPHSPAPDIPPRGTLGRSHPSHDGSRSSRFTENV